MNDEKKDKNYKSINLCIKEKRELKGLSIRELSKKADISNVYISLLENGKVNNPSVKILNKLANALDIELIELIK